MNRVRAIQRATMLRFVGHLVNDTIPKVALKTPNAYAHAWQGRGTLDQSKYFVDEVLADPVLAGASSDKLLREVMRRSAGSVNPRTVKRHIETALAARDA